MRPRIIDITNNNEYRDYLYKCLPKRFRKHRDKYLEEAIPNGLCKKILIWENEVVGQIEYVPAGFSALPIKGDGVYVMNCIWVLRKAKGHNFGKLLLDNTIRSIRDKAEALSTIALEGYPSNWCTKLQMEKLGFRSIDCIELRNKVGQEKKKFKVYLMWIPIKKYPKIPLWNTNDLLKGITFCSGHPLYHQKSPKLKEVFGFA